MDDAKLLILP
jgi:CheY-like chemotaxis protein